jgi:hypothetical protein
MKAPGWLIGPAAMHEWLGQGEAVIRAELFWIRTVVMPSGPLAGMVAVAERGYCQLALGAVITTRGAPLELAYTKKATAPVSAAAISIKA